MDVRKYVPHHYRTKYYASTIHWHILPLLMCLNEIPDQCICADRCITTWFESLSANQGTPLTKSCFQY